MDPLRPIRAFDRSQQKHHWLAVPVAVIKKFADDQGGRLAALVAYYAFFSLFPLLLALVSALGFVLEVHPTLREDVLDTALARIPDDMETDKEVLALLRIAADHLANAGYDVVETEVPDLGGTWKLWCDLIMTELSVLQEAQMRDFGSADFGRTLDGFLKMATVLDGRGYMEAIAYRSRVLRNWLAFLESYALILTPLSVKRTPEVNADLGGDARVRSLFWNDLRFMSSIRSQARR